MRWITSSPDELEALDEIYAADDRAAAIVGASFLDVRVETAIRARLIDDKKLLDELLRDGGPIGAFATKIQVGFALGIYGPETKRDLHLIAKIRNRFAHKISVKSFETECIKQRCHNLTLIDRYIFDNQTPNDQIKWVKGLTLKIEERDVRMAKARERYLASVSLISSALHPVVERERDRPQAHSESATGLP